MKRGILWMVLLAMGVLLGGCLPERVVWSPDGTRALVLGDDGLHVCDADGKLGPVLVKDVTRAAWLPDGKRIVVAGTKNFSTWGEIIKANPGAAVSKDLAAKVRSALIDSGNNGDKYEAAVADLSQDEKTRASIFLRDSEPGLAAAIGENLRQLLAAERHYSPSMCQVYDMGAGEAKAGPVIFWGRESDTLEIRVSRSGKYLAVTAVKYEQKSKAPRLAVAAIAPNAGVAEVLELGEGGAFPDWGVGAWENSLVYYRPYGGGDEEAKMGSICRQVVVADDGRLFSADHLPGREDLVGAMFDRLGRVRCAADGRIFFDAVEVALPATPRDAPSRATLFLIHPGKQATITRAIPRVMEQQLGEALVQFFELSPDGQWISIPSEDGRVAVLNIGTGVLDSIQDEEIARGSGKESLVTVPTWRSPAELTYAQPKDGGLEMVRSAMSDAGRKVVVLSNGWGDAVRGDWLKKPGPKAETKKADMP